MKELQEKAEQLGIVITDQQAEQFQIYYDRLIEKNKVMNLTAITEYQEVIDKHFIDSILLGTVIDLSKEQSMIDVGTGAGFPGIPLKIVYPELEITLLDSLNKRVKFLEEVVAELKLQNIQAVHMRAEDGGQSKEHREQYDICVSRAVANLATLCEYCLPFVKKGGCFVSYKAAKTEEELMQAEHAIKVLGGKIKTVKELSLPDAEGKRTLVVIEKIAKTPKQYPRKAGIASKEPIQKK